MRLLLVSGSIRARQILDYRLKKDELRHTQFVPLELLAEPIVPRVRPG
jgi:hypothetical protein